MKKFLQSQPILVLTSLNAILTSIITYIQFLTPEQKLSFVSMGNLIVILKSIGAGLFAFGFIQILIIIVQKVITEKIQPLINDINFLDKKYDDELVTVYQRLLIHEAINIHRTDAIYGLPNNLEIHTRENLSIDAEIINEIKWLRENFRNNRDTYKVSLDILENEIKRMYPNHYDK